MSSTINGPGPSALQVNYFEELERANLPMKGLAEGASVTIAWKGGQNSRSDSASPAVITSLSPAAQDALGQSNQSNSVTPDSGVAPGLSREEIALQLIAKSTYTRHPSVTAAQSANQPGALTTVGSQAVTGPLVSPPASAISEPSLEQLKSMSAADRFYTTTSLQKFLVGTTPDEAATFGAAYQSRTLNIQSAADVPQLDFKSSWTFTGDGGDGSFSFNSNWAAQQYGNYFVGSNPFFGGSIISLGPPSSDGSEGSTAVASGAS